MPGIVEVPRRHLDPIAHILRVSGGRFSRAPLLWLQAIDGAPVVLGVVAFGCRYVCC
jgi:ABC-2 type transport system permease protein